jgi:hypothetical protein
MLTNQWKVSTLQNQLKDLAYKMCHITWQYQQLHSFSFSGLHMVKHTQRHRFGLISNGEYTPVFAWWTKSTDMEWHIGHRMHTLSWIKNTHVLFLQFQWSTSILAARPECSKVVKINSASKIFNLTVHYQNRSQETLAQKPINCMGMSRQDSWSLLL